MSDNKHHAYAEASFSSANAAAEPEFNEAVRADALIQATLAAAYEQRTANLIAWFGDGGDGLRFDMELHAQITERLGLS